MFLQMHLRGRAIYGIQATMICVEQLPDDPALLKCMLVEQHACHEAEKEAAIRAAVAAEIQAAVDEAVQAAVAKAIKETTALFLRRFYGPRNERFDPRQLLLFGLKIDEMPLDEASIADESQEELVTRRVAKRHKHGRSPLPDHLPRIDIEHDLDDTEKPCPACGELRERIGQEVSEQLEYLPASFKVLRHIRHKYGCRRCEHDGYNPQIAAAAKPAQPIDKGLPGPGLLAYVATSKLADHLPLYRLEHIFQRQNLAIARSTMCAWLAAAGELVRPLVARMTLRVLLSRAVHTDDTPVPIQSPGEGKCRKGRLWAYLGDAANPYIVYDYTPDRARAGPANWLRDYKGYLQADAYGGYDGIYAGSNGQVIEVACWAHARRNSSRPRKPTVAGPPRCSRWSASFTRSRTRPRRWTTISGARFARRRAADPRADQGVARRRATDSAAAQRDGPGNRLRFEPVGCLVRLRDRGLLGHRQQCRRAGDEARGHRTEELALRGQRPGGRNHGAALYADCQRQRHGVDPQRYLTSVFAKLPFTPEEELDQFLPDVWKKDDVAEPPPQ